MIEYKEIIKENSIVESDRLILRLFTIGDVVTEYLTWPSHTDISQTKKVVKEFYIGNIGTYAI